MSARLLKLAVIVFVVAVFVGATAQELFGVLLDGWNVPRRFEQPYAYNHKVHVAKADCVLCHQGAYEGEHAGLPDLQFCTGCHVRAPGKNPSQQDQQLWTAAAKGEAPAWNRYFQVPSHVFFSHRRHVALGGLKCRECHGDMQDQQRPPKWATAPLRMAICVNCHKKNKVTVDCTACHR